MKKSKDKQKNSKNETTKKPSSIKSDQEKKELKIDVAAIRKLLAERAKPIQRKPPLSQDLYQENDIPETIADEIITKIISLVIYQVRVKEIYEGMGTKCNEYLDHLITPYLATEFIYYEDGIENVEDKKRKNALFFCSTPPPKLNTWVKIEEPETPIYDRYASSLSKVVGFKKEEGDEDININKVISDSTMDKSKKIELIRRKSLVNAMKEIKEINTNKSITGKLKESSENSSITSRSKFSSVDKNKLFSYSDMTKTKTDEEQRKIIELPSYDLPKEKYENIYCIINNNEENNLLIKEREILLIKKEEQKLLLEQEAKRIQLRKAHLRIAKDIDGNRLTFDPDGKIMSIKQPNSDNFSNDFCVLKRIMVTDRMMEQSSSSLASNNNENNINNQGLSSGEDKSSLKKVKYTKNLNYNNILEKELNKKSVQDNKYENRRRMPGEEYVKPILALLKKLILPKLYGDASKKQKKLKSTDDFFTSSENISIKTPSHIPVDENNFGLLKDQLPSFRHVFGFFLEKYIYKGKIEHNPDDRTHFWENLRSKKIRFAPVGSNFNKMEPEIGVIVHNENSEKIEIKDGGFEFVKKYNKPSMFEFSKLAEETSVLNSQKFASSSLLLGLDGIDRSQEDNYNNKDNKEENQQGNNIENLEYNGYNEEFDLNNPLIQGAHSLMDRSRIVSSIRNQSGKSNSILTSDQSNALLSQQLPEVLDKDKIPPSQISNNNLNSMMSLNSLNSILLSDKIRAPNLVSFFRDRPYSQINPEGGNSEQSSQIVVGNLKQNVSSILPSIRIPKERKPLPLIQVNKNRVLSNKKEKERGKNIMNKFNYRIIKNKKWGEDYKIKFSEFPHMNAVSKQGLLNNNILSMGRPFPNNRIIGLKNNLSSLNIRERKSALVRSSSAGQLY